MRLDVLRILGRRKSSPFSEFQDILKYKEERLSSFDLMVASGLKVRLGRPWIKSLLSRKSHGITMDQSFSVSPIMSTTLKFLESKKSWYTVGYLLCLTVLVVPTFNQCFKAVYVQIKDCTVRVGVATNISCLGGF